MHPVKQDSEERGETTRHRSKHQVKLRTHQPQQQTDQGIVLEQRKLGDEYENFTYPMAGANSRAAQPP